MKQEVEMEVSKLKTELDKLCKVIDAALNNGLDDLVKQLFEQKDELEKKILALEMPDVEESPEPEEVQIDAPFRNLLLLIEVNKEDINDETLNILSINGRCYSILHSSQV